MTTKNISPNPETLFETFRNRNLKESRQAVANFKTLDPEVKQTFLQVALNFLETEKEDTVRSWATEVLSEVGGEKSYKALVNLLEQASDDEKQQYRFTRFFALRALWQISKTDTQRNKTRNIIEKISNDKKEQGLIWAGSLILPSLGGQRDKDDKLKELLLNHSERGGYWGTLAALRALREFPTMRFAEDILVVLRDGEYLDLRIYALKALRHRIYHEEIKVTRALGDIIITDPDRILTLEAVRTLAILKNREGEEDLYRALVNDDAEIRVQASIALQALLSAEEAVATIIQRALATDTERTVIGYYVEALRRIDPDRKLSADILSKELTGQDQVRSQAAERILIDLGGWTAIHRLSQRRNTLETLDKLLAESEAAVKDTFNDTIVQAQRNFYFAMAVNIMVVIVGLVLIIIAIRQIIIDPGLLESWIVPGGAGVLGILFNLAFNNPRRNAREDLTTLMNVNVIFLGFLRQLNEIDATFKHAYIESDDFSPDDMKKTVERIEKVTSETLELARQHLLQTTGKQKGNQ